MADIHVYFHVPTAIFRARVNAPGAISYPVTALPFDTVTLGTFSDLQPGQTLLLGSASGLDDLGRVRVQNLASSTQIPVGRVSRGVEDGTLEVVDNAFLTVWEDYRVFAKLPYIDLDAGIDFKDGDIAVGDYSVEIPPVAIMGAGFADYIDPATSLITVTFDSSPSYAMADGATIVSRTWDIQDGTLVSGTLTSTSITVTFPAGFRYVFLSVVDSNGQGHTTGRPVLAVDPAADVTIDNTKCQVTQRLTLQGQTLDVQMYADLPRTSWPDGCLVMMFDGAPTGPADRSNIRFIGYLQSESATMRATKTGLVRDTVLHCLDVAGRLDTLPGFPQALQREDDPEVDEQWSLMPGLDMNKALHYLLHWHSTALTVADFFLPALGDSYPSMRIDTAGATLYDQVNSTAIKIDPDHLLTCNRLGQLSVLADWMLVDVGDRPAASSILTEDDYSELSVDYHRPPRVHVLRNSAVIASTDWLVIGGVNTLPLAFAIAPGDAFSQGTSEETEAEGLTLSQALLNKTTGHKYARRNARFGLARLKLPAPDCWDYEPALLNRIQLNIAAAYAAQRGLPFTQVNCMVKELSVRYVTDKRGTWVDPELVLEFETSGYPAQTVIPEIPEPVDDYETPPPPDPWTPPLPGDDSVFYGDMKAYILWDSAHVMRTWDIKDSPPVWSLVDTGITGTILDGSYIHVSASAVGMWLLTSNGVFVCMDIMATTPSWTHVLTLATVIAAEVQIAGFPSIFTAMEQYRSEPGYLIVATAPSSNSVDDVANFAHAYSWHTHDYGATWTTVDMVEFTETGLGFTSCFAWCDLYCIQVYASSPVIFMLRKAAYFASGASVFQSFDGGHTWLEGVHFTNRIDGALLGPFPDIAGNAYMVVGSEAGADWPDFYVSTDAFTTTPGELTTPSGYRGMPFGLRPNRYTLDETHLIAHFVETPGTGAVLLESTDSGATWTLLRDDGLTETVVQTPNGWPPDQNQWVDIRREDSSGVSSAFVVRYTDDNFVTMSDKRGNLAALIGTWQGSPSAGNSGFALPRTGQNI